MNPTSVYRFFLMKPTAMFQEAFNLEREIIVVFSSYPNFEPRTIDAFDAIKKQHQTLRIERICTILISRDLDIEAKLSALLKNDQEHQIIIPFTYEELLTKDDPQYVANRFRKYFYTRDLFDFQSPLKKDLYFFGMRDLVQTLVNKHQPNENTALFGLRKSGKTSVIYGVERTLDRLNVPSVRIDCEFPGMHTRRWNTALWFVLHEIKRKYNLITDVTGEEKFTEQNCSILFEEDLRRLKGELQKDTLVLILDEIEQITFETSASSHWRDGYDFVFFWQTLRSLFQKSHSLFSYMIVGTNPMCLEVSDIKGRDNPIFQQTSAKYIPRFDVEQTKEMVETLGRSMGLRFDYLLYSKLCEDFGGHPFLIRQICSLIHKNLPIARPVQVDRSIYQASKAQFMKESSGYIEMVLVVLKSYYKDEYDMLTILASGDTSDFMSLATSSPAYTNHLLGYGIIEKTYSGYAFRIEAIKNYLEAELRYRKLSITPEECRSEISVRRNELEPKLRHIVRIILKASIGATVAKDRILEVLGPDKRKKYGGLSYESLFDTNKTELYFNNLITIILKYWQSFENIFGRDRTEFERRMKAINKSRKADAHATDYNEIAMAEFRSCISAIENQVSEFLN